MLRFVLFFFTLSVSAVVQGSVVIMGTRVVYPATQKSISIRLNNDNESPALVQSWLDDGDAAAPPESVHVPFIITPPIFRMDSKSGQTVRIDQDKQSELYIQASHYRKTENLFSI